MLKSRCHSAQMPWSQGPQLRAESCEQNPPEEQGAETLPPQDLSQLRKTCTFLTESTHLLEQARCTESVFQQTLPKAKRPGLRDRVHGSLGRPWNVIPYGHK